MNIIKACSEFPKYYGAQSIIPYVEKDTTPEEFDQLLEGESDKILELGGRINWTILAVASIKGNVALIRHIVEKGGKKLLSLGNIHGMTPLYATAKLCEDPEAAFQASKLLIELGADVNLATRTLKTALGAAAKTNNLKLVKLLLTHGAIIPPFLVKGREVIYQAQEQHADLNQLLEALRNQSDPITDYQFWSDFCHKDQNTILLFGEELRNRFKTANLMWLLESIMHSANDRRDFDLLKCLILMEPKSLNEVVTWSVLNDEPDVVGNIFQALPEKSLKQVFKDQRLYLNISNELYWPKFLIISLMSATP